MIGAARPEGYGKMRMAQSPQLDGGSVSLETVCLECTVQRLAWYVCCRPRTVNRSTRFRQPISICGKLGVKLMRPSSPGA